MLLHVAYQLRFLLVKFQLDRVLSEKDPRTVEVTLHSLPMKIKDAYKDILARISLEGNAQRVLKTLSWVYHAQEPLLMDELLEALTIEFGDTRVVRKFQPDPALVLEDCKSLITYDKASGIVKLTHHTVYQFLSGPMLPRLLTFVDLAKILLTYLSFDVFKKPCPGGAELESRFQSHKLCRYAGRWWPKYARGAGERDTQLQTLLFRLFECAQHTESLLQIDAMSVDIPEHGSCLIHYATFYRLSHICRLVLNGAKCATSPLHNPQRRPALLAKAEVLEGGTEEVLLSGQVLGDAYSRDAFGETPLHIAARLGYPEIVQLFVDANADVNAKSKNSADMTPLHLAAAHAHDEVVCVLVKANAELEVEGTLCPRNAFAPCRIFGAARSHEYVAQGKGSHWGNYRRGARDCHNESL